MDMHISGTTINAESMSRETVIKEFIHLFRNTVEQLQQEKELSPENTKVPEIIGRLMSRLRTRFFPEEVQAVLSDSYIRSNQRKLQEKLSEAEFLAELSDAKKLASNGTASLDMLEAMPIWRVYNALVTEELSVLRSLLHLQGKAKNGPIVFVGSGPLPLSPIMLHLFGNGDVVALEKDEAAYETSCNLLKQMGLDLKINVKHTDGADFDYGSYGNIFVASLVRNKKEVMDRISHTSPNALVAVRTAEGIRQIMYEAIDESELHRQGWRILDRTSPDGKQVINSTLFLGWRG